jgi:hypothetical protein
LTLAEERVVDMSFNFTRARIYAGEEQIDTFVAPAWNPIILIGFHAAML